MTARVYEGCRRPANRRPRRDARASVPSAVVRRTIAAIGRDLVTLGLLILLFVAYQLWGTGIFTARAQDDLKHEFDSELAAVAGDNPVVTTADDRPTPGKPTRPRRPRSRRCSSPPPEGEPIGVIQIPKIGVDKVFVEGIELRRPRRRARATIPARRCPGQIGNAAIAGHRTTYGAPFYDLDELAPGDEIIDRRRSPASTRTP